MFVKPVKKVNREINVTSDKSITHRAVMFNSIAKGNAVVTGALLGEDCLGTIECMRRLGAHIEVRDGNIYIAGTNKLKSGAELDVGNSGTSIRLLTGLISGMGISAGITGDASIQKRPIQRVVNPLEQMGAAITTNKGFAPVKIRPAKLQGINYVMPVASAQVKSAVILAALNAEGTTVITEGTKSRNHTELMLKAMGADIEVSGNTVTVKKSVLRCADVEVPRDISSAAYFMVLGTILPNSRIVIPGVGVNPTRTGIIDVINGAGGKITLINKRTVCGEDIADIVAESAELTPFRIEGDIVPRLIDEIPALAVLAAFIKGKSVIVDSQELRVKESDRIATTVDALKRTGVNVSPKPDGMVIEGGGRIKGGEIDAYNDHRIAMSMAIAGLCSEEGVKINGHECAGVSFPGFFELINGL